VTEELQLPDGFPTRVFVGEVPDPSLLPGGSWTLLGDEAVRETWRAQGLPEPEGTLWVPVLEAEKRLGTLVPWLEHWARIPLVRGSQVVAVGGGVLLDMAGLAASLYLRGVAWHAWPTTLLSQVDAGLGGKTAVDLAAGKNLAGAFHPPLRMVAARAFLATLPPRQVASGAWEILKMALVEGDLDWARALLAAEAPDGPSLGRALALKGHIVARDPFEQGERRLLNLGHTLGHALEAASGYALLHGEAVGLGTLAACCLAASEGLPPFPAPFLEDLAGRLAPLAGLVAPWEACRPWLQRDKKGCAGSLPGQVAIHCILPVPHQRAEQRLLPPEAWASAHGRMTDLLT
jgi:3-dehydroquinate synthetase